MCWRSSPPDGTPEGLDRVRETPAMEAGVTDHIWSIEEIVGLLDWVAAQPPQAGESTRPTT